MYSMADTSMVRRLPRPPCLARGVAKVAGKCQRGRFRREGDQRGADCRPCRKDPERDRGDDSQRPLRSDEQVDQVHPGPGIVAGRQLRHERHPIRGNRNRDRLRVEPQLEPPVACPRSAALDVQDVAGRQDHAQRLDPVARRPVLECRGAGGVGGDGAADERAAEGRGRRIQTSCPFKRPVQRLERHACPDADAVRAHHFDAGQPPGTDDRFAHWRRSARERRLSADGQHGRCRSKNFCDLRFGRRRRHLTGVSAREVRGIFEIGGEEVGIARPLAASRRPAGRARAQ